MEAMTFHVVSERVLRPPVEIKGITTPPIVGDRLKNRLELLVCARISEVLTGRSKRGSGHEKREHHGCSGPRSSTEEKRDGGYTLRKEEHHEWNQEEQRPREEGVLIEEDGDHQKDEW